MTDARPLRAGRPSLRGPVLGLAWLVLAGLLLAGCGGAAHPSPPTAWTKSFCGGVAAVVHDSDQFQSSVPSLALEAPARLQADFAGGLEQVAKDYRSAAAAVRAAGAPRIPRGGKVQDVVLGALDRGASLFSSAAATVTSASPTATAVKAAVASATSDLRTGSAEVGAAFTSLNGLDSSGALSDAAGTDTDCSFLG